LDTAWHRHLLKERANKEASRLAKLRAKTDAKTNPKSAWRIDGDGLSQLQPDGISDEDPAAQ